MHAMHALYAVPSNLLDITWLLQHPGVADLYSMVLWSSFPWASSPQGLALLAGLGTLDHVRSKSGAPAHLLPHANTSAYLSKCKEDDMFDHVENAIARGLQVSWLCSSLRWHVVYIKQKVHHAVIFIVLEGVVQAVASDVQIYL